MEKVWTRNQAYTALSRAKSLSGLKVKCPNQLADMREGGRLLTRSRIDDILEDWMEKNFQGVRV